MAAIADQLEPAATDAVGSCGDDLIALASIAISLKRLADSFDNPGSTKGSVLWWLETIASAAEAGRS